MIKDFNNWIEKTTQLNYKFCFGGGRGGGVWNIIQGQKWDLRSTKSNPYTDLAISPMSWFEGYFLKADWKFRVITIAFIPFTTTHSVFYVIWHIPKKRCPNHHLENVSQPSKIGKTILRHLKAWWAVNNAIRDLKACQLWL